MVTKINDKSTSVSEMVDGFMYYKYNRYKNKIESAVKKIKGETTFESEIFRNDLMEG